MDMVKAISITLDQIKRHRKIAEYADKLGECILAKSHSDIAEALETIMESNND